MDPVATSEWLIMACVGIAVLLVVLLMLRRRWISRGAGLFECSLKVPSDSGKAAWALGITRYRGGSVEWFRSLSFGLRPAFKAERGALRVLGQRRPSPTEATALYADQVIVEVAVRSRDVIIEAAMTADALTALLAWLEAAPPGRRYQG